MGLTSASGHVRCLAHILHLAVTDAVQVLRFDNHDTLVGKLRAIVTKIRASPQRMQRFLHLQKAHRDSPLKPILDVKTRWNSTFDMITRAKLIRLELDEFVMSDREGPVPIRVSGIFRSAKKFCTNSWPPK
jgi:hypothetical protein